VDEIAVNTQEPIICKRVLSAFSGSNRQIIEDLSNAIKFTMSDINGLLEKTDERQEIINLAAQDFSKLFDFIKANNLIKALDSKTIVEIIRQRNVLNNNMISSSSNEDIRTLSSNDSSELDDFGSDYFLEESIHTKILSRVMQEIEAERSRSLLQDAETKDDEIYFYNIEEPVPNFVGREEIIENMNQYFLNNENGIQVIGGLCGIGKTQTVLKYISLFKERYNYRVRRIQAQNQESLELSFRSFATELRLNIDNLSTEEDVIKLVKTRLASGVEHSLLLFDNVNDYQLIKKYLPDVGGVKKHHIIITTKNFKEFEDSANFYLKLNLIKLNNFTPEEASQFVQDSLEKEREERALELAKLVSFIPLGLSQSVSYIKIHNIKIRSYLKEHSRLKDAYPNTLPEKLYENKNDPHEHNIYIAIMMTLENLASNAPDAFKILKVCSYIAADDIPYSLFNAMFSEVHKVNEAIAILAGYSLISVRSKKGKEYIFIHRILQVVVRNKIRNEQEEILKYSIELVSNQIGDGSEEIIFNFKRNLLLLQHSLSLIEQYNSIQFSNDQNREEQLAGLYYKIGNIYFVNSQFSLSMDKYKEANTIYIKYHGQKYSQVALIYCAMGAIYQVYGDNDNALILYNNALAIYKDLLGESSKKIANILCKIAFIYLNNGKENEAKIMYNQAIAIYQTLSEEQQEPYKVADIKRAIGEIQKILENYDEALSKYKEALVIYTKENNYPHKIAELKFEIGSILKIKKIYAEALKMFNQALEMNKDIFGRSHFNVAKILKEISFVSMFINKPINAMVYGVQALEVSVLIFGNNHLFTASIYVMIGDIYAMQNKYKEVLEQYAFAMPVYQRVYGQEHHQLNALIDKINNINSLLLNNDITTSFPSSDLLLKIPTTTDFIVGGITRAVSHNYYNNIRREISDDSTSSRVPSQEDDHQIHADDSYNEVINSISDSVEKGEMNNVYYIELNNFESIAIDYNSIFSFAIAYTIENLPNLKYFSKKIIKTKFLPEFLDENYIKATIHFVACHYCFYSLTNKINIIQASIPTISYVARMSVNEYIKHQEEPIRDINEYIQKCGFPITLQTVISTINYFNDPITFHYDVFISATVAGIGCLDHHNQQELRTETYFEHILAYSMDILVFSSAMNYIHFDLTGTTGMVIAIKQGFSVVSVVVTTDYISRFTASHLEKFYLDHLQVPMGELHSNFITLFYGE
ncbi:MAG: tetratricopeptide repeat protein, partial [Pseudomonadota bacterium]